MGCFMDENIQSIKPCHPLFNTREEFESIAPVWAKLNNMPIELFYDYRLKEIGNDTGNLSLYMVEINLILHTTWIIF